MSHRESHIGTVVANQDPELRGRIKCACAGILGSEDEALPMWIPPIAEWGWFFVPDIGELVELEMIASESDDESFQMASIANHDIRWRGRHWSPLGEGENARAIPEDFKTNYSKRRGFTTPRGHVFFFDDTKGKEKINLMWAGGSGDKADKFAYMSFDEDGSWLVSNKNGSLLYFNAKDNESSWIDQFGNSLRMGETGIAMTDKFSNVIEMKDGVVQILSAGAVTVSCKDATIDAGNIELAPPAVDHMLKGETFMALFAAHIHPSGMGPTGPPVPTGTEALALSQKAKVGG